LFVLHRDGFKVFSLEDLAAIETFHVFDTVSSGDHLGTGVVTSRLHNQRLDEEYFIHVSGLVKTLLVVVSFDAILLVRVTILVMAFPTQRLRRLRASESLRSLVRETHLHPGQFVLPLFVCPGEGVRREIGAMPGNSQMSIDEL